MNNTVTQKRIVLFTVLIREMLKHTHYELLKIIRNHIYIFLGLAYNLIILSLHFEFSIILSNNKVW